MYVMTDHFTLLAIDVADNTLMQVRSLTLAEARQLIDVDPTEASRLEAELPRSGEQGIAMTSGPLTGYRYVRSNTPGAFHLFKEQFVRATPEMGPVLCDAAVASRWETFTLVSPEDVETYFQVHGRGGEAFGERVRTLIEQRTPVCLHLGCGPRRIKGFLNIDNYAGFGDPTDYFLFDIVEKPWPIPDSSVDYIYSEDFIEHIPQRAQVAVLAEAFRVLKTNCFHRISTPCLVASMKKHSDFSKGFLGVYFGEFDNWSHISVFTRGMMTDLAQVIGYRQVFFTAKSHGSSPHAVADLRPGGDRDEQTGNIYADLLK